MSFIEIVVLGVALAMDAFAVTISDAFAYRGQPRWRAWMGPVAYAVFQALMPVAGFWLGNLFGDVIETYVGIVTFIILGLIGGNMIREGIRDLRAGQDAAASDAETSVTAVTEANGKAAVEANGKAGVEADGKSGAGSGAEAGIGGVAESAAALAAGSAAEPAAPEMLTVPKVIMQAIATSIDAFAVGVSLRATGADIVVSAWVIGLTTFLCCAVALLIGRKFGELLGERAQVVGGAVLVAIGVKSLLGL
jgi:putative Mn2+ efflux pump MntP